MPKGCVRRMGGKLPFGILFREKLLPSLRLILHRNVLSKYPPLGSYHRAGRTCRLMAHRCIPRIAMFRSLSERSGHRPKLTRIVSAANAPNRKSQTGIFISADYRAGLVRGVISPAFPPRLRCVVARPDTQASCVHRSRSARQPAYRALVLRRYWPAYPPDSP
jgi:hypothetical protein